MALLERLQRDLLELLGDLELWRAELLGGALEDPRARILGAVDAVAEAHDPLARLKRLAHPALGVAELLGLVEHRLDVRGRPAVQRAGEGADGR